MMIKAQASVWNNDGRCIAQVSFDKHSVAPPHACTFPHPMVARDVLYWQHVRGYNDVLDGSATEADYRRIVRRYKRRGYHVVEITSGDDSEH